MLLVFIICLLLFILWTMLKCASIYDEIEDSYEYKNNINLKVTKK